MQKIKITFTLFTAATLLALICGGPAFAKVLAPDEMRIKVMDKLGKAEGIEYVQDEIVVKFKGDAEPFRVIKVPKGQVGTKIKEFLQKQNIEFAEPNYIAYALMVPNDPYYFRQWHLDNAAHSGGIDTEQAWDISKGDGVVVAVIDTGIAYEDYGSYQKATDLTSTCFVAGYDYINNDSHPNDDHGHGTHVAGTVAQSTNNNLGVAGVAYKACLMPVKVLNQNGSGSYTQVADGIRWAANNGAKVINLSLGGTSPSSILEDAVAYAHNKGVTVVAAAGNNSSSSVSYPAAYDNYVIAVGATRYDETLSYYSNYGTSLDVVAPGGDTRVNQNGDSYADGVLQQTFTTFLGMTIWGYYLYQGTSMASPHVAGTAALLIAKGTASSPDTIRAALQETAKDLGAQGRDNTYGWGLINAYAALGWQAGQYNYPPQIEITNPTEGAEVSGVISIEANATDDKGIDNVEFFVDNNSIGKDTNGSDGWSKIWDSSGVADGNHTIKATVTDIGGKQATDTINITTDNINELPQANAGPDKNVIINDTVNFDGSSSYDPDGNIVSYAWNFGDGGQGNGTTTSHIYTATGTYTVTLTVTDNKGATDQDTAIVNVKNVNHAPIAQDQSVTTNEDTVVAITLVATDEDGDILTYSIVSQPTKGTLSGTAPNVTYTPNSNFNGSDSFTFKANDGTVDSNTATVSITVNPVNDAPQANAGPNKTGNINESITFDGSGSSDPDGTSDIISYEWDFGDGGQGSGVTVSHTYTAGGTYTVTLTVKDNGGLTSQDTALVEISQSTIPTMHVGNITLTSEKVGIPGWSWCRVKATVPILDAAGQGVPQATVSGSWSGAYTQNVSGQTASNGKATFTSGWVLGCGTFTFTVKNVTKTDWMYNSQDNIETSDSITIAASASADRPKLAKLQR